MVYSVPIELRMEHAVFALGIPMPSLRNGSSCVGAKFQPTYAVPYNDQHDQHDCESMYGYWMFGLLTCCLLTYPRARQGLAGSNQCGQHIVSSAGSETTSQLWRSLYDITWNSIGFLYDHPAAEWTKASFGM